MTIQINGTTGISGVDGSAATPALQGSDTNTGISFGTDEVQINTGGTQRATVDASGRLLVGTSSAFNGVPNGANINLLSSDQFGPQFGMRGTHNSSDPVFLLMDRARGSSVVQSGDTIMQFDCRGFDGTNYLALARIAAFVDGTPGANDMPGRLVFSTTADGASSPTERARITSDGDIVISQAAGRYTLDTSPGAVVVANNGTIDFANASGVLFANAHTNGAVTIWLIGGGFVSAIGSVVNTVGAMSYVSAINGYRWTNNSGSSGTFSFMFFRTREHA